MTDRWALPAGTEVDPAFARLHAYWLGKCKNGLLPARTDIDPLEIPRDLLPGIALLEVERQADGTQRYRIRLFGSALAAMTGADETGRYYDEAVSPAGYAVLRPLLDRTVSEAQPMFLAAPSAAPGRGFLHFGRFGLPLAADGRTVDMILALVRPLPGPDPASPPI
ncbi:MAG: PAS domain-containing protein [Alphaproteobacteria bacterium]|nr:PAS domain-containing protein [Alphaproteobacteria bacterium]